MAIMTMVERKSGFSVIVKVSQKTSELASRAVIEGLGPYATRVIRLNYDNDKEFVSHIQIDQGSKHELLCQTLFKLGAGLQRQLQ